MIQLTFESTERNNLLIMAALQYFDVTVRLPMLESKPYYNVMHWNRFSPKTESSFFRSIETNVHNWSMLSRTIIDTAAELQKNETEDHFYEMLDLLRTYLRVYRIRENSYSAIIENIDLYYRHLISDGLTMIYEGTNAGSESIDVAQVYNKTAMEYRLENSQAFSLPQIAFPIFNIELANNLLAFRKKHEQERLSLMDALKNTKPSHYPITANMFGQYLNNNVGCKDSDCYRQIRESNYVKALCQEYGQPEKTLIVTPAYFTGIKDHVAAAKRRGDIVFRKRPDSLSEEIGRTENPVFFRFEIENNYYP